MKQLCKSALTLSVLTAAAAFLKDSCPWFILVLCLLIWRKRTQDHSWIYVLPVLILVLIPRYDRKMPAWHTGTVRAVKTHYAIVQNGNSKLIVNTDADLILDSKISFTGTPQLLEGTGGFYSYDFPAACRRQGIYYSLISDSPAVIQESRSLRGLVQKKVLAIEDSGKQATLLRILFGIRSDQKTFESFLEDTGISSAAMLSLLSMLLGFFLFPEEKDQLLTAAAFASAVFWHFPYLLTQRLILRLLKLFRIPYRERLGIGLTLSILLDPSAVHSASFLIPAVFAYASCLSEHPKQSSFLAGMMMQSCLFHNVNPLQMILLKKLFPLLGVFRILAWIELLTGWNLLWILDPFDHVLSFLKIADLPGSMLGAGLLLYLLAAAVLKHLPHPRMLLSILFLCFQITGLFHPFAEVSFLNVGQGDSILIRESLNRCNVLIDTGKPSAWKAVSASLEGRGIRRLDTLFISHPDEDHNGNQELITDTYHPRNVITGHHGLTACRNLEFLDLNELQETDENRSSQVLYLKLNGLNYLFMGDADQIAEQEILKHYDALDCDVLKLSHHGSKTGSSEAFLNQAKPLLAIISAGSYSIYHHPHPDTIQKLLARRIPFLNTRTAGEIRILCLGRFNVVLTSGGLFGILL